MSIAAPPISASRRHTNVPAFQYALPLVDELLRASRCGLLLEALDPVRRPSAGLEGSPVAMT